MTIRQDCNEPRRRNPFQIICGTSAGAINGLSLACRSDHIETAIRAMVEVWRDFRCEQVYEADSLGSSAVGRNGSPCFPWDGL